jgi:predicted nucleic acid-binding protein
MSGKSPIIYWDTGILLSWLKDEARGGPEEKAGILECVKRHDAKEVQIAVSTLVRVEILDSLFETEEQRDAFSGFLRSSQLSLVSPHFRIMEEASALRDFYGKNPLPGVKKTLSTPDAIHLATALSVKAEVFYTFDEKNSKKALGLLQLDGDVAGHPLKIKKPSHAQLSLPGMQ